MADIQLNFVGKDERSAQSHDIAKRIRPGLQAIGDRYGARIKIAEIPPGPPVLDTLVAEVYGPNPKRQVEIAKSIKDIFQNTAGVVDVDWYVEADQKKLTFDVDPRQGRTQRRERRGGSTELANCIERHISRSGPFRTGKGTRGAFHAHADCGTLIIVIA